LIFRELAKGRAAIWIARDVYPVYLELARAAAIEPLLFTTLPKPQLPARKSEGRLEYMLVTNPWKPLGRFLTDVECDALTDWLDASPGRQVLVDCVYDLGTPFHPTTQRLWETGRAILLHSFTKGWLSPKTFGVALIQGGQSHLDAVFRDNSPTQEQLAFAEKLISTHAELPAQVVAALKAREESLMAHLPAPVKSCLLLHPDSRSPGTYFFAVEINAEELLRQHEILAVPASAFGADWDGSVISSLAESFSSMKNVNPME
jgi:aspartate/methionine/tyrosine aminotransferase